MSLVAKVKELSKSKDILKEEKLTLKTLLGEFDRINDGKLISDEEAINTIKKFIKNIDESLSVIEEQYIINHLNNEKSLLQQFLPKTANEDQMLMVIENVFLKNNFKNNMEAIKPCIKELNSMGFDVDNKKLSNLIKIF